MERIVKHITKRLVEELPEEQETYKLSELHSSAIPRFVVKRVEVELERNLAESIVLPETEWADMESETVRQAWEQFVSAIRAQARLPASYTYAVLETAVSDIMDILVQPRKNLPDVIFGASEELEYQQVVDRMDAIVVYRHFGSLIPRYMEKKGLNTLSKKRCAKIIKQADEKLTDRYTPLNWAQMLEPLFILMEEQIDSNLLRLFYEDKNMPRLAREFDLMNRSLNRSQLIEVLSSPDLPVDDDQQNELFATKASPPERPDDSTGWEGLVKPAESKEQDDEPEIQQMESDQSSDNEDVLEQFYEEEKEGVKDSGKEDEDEDRSLHEFFADEEDAGEEEAVTDEKLKELIDQDEREQPDDQTETDTRDENIDGNGDLSNEITSAGEEGTDDEKGAEVEDVEEEQPPMWQKFMSSQDLEEDEGEEDRENRTPAKDEEFEDEEEEAPLIDLTKEEGPGSERVQQLKKKLQTDRQRFVDDIFNGAEEAYEQALEEISGRDDWQTASRYIEKDIFKRNLVDMYSETAVDFTDRLHSYFIEAENKTS